MSPDRKHEKARQPFVCPDCGLQYAGDISRHRRQHQSNRKDLEWTCKSCGFGDLQRYNVLEHYVRTHTTDEPHECPLTTKDARGSPIPCAFRCQSSSVLTKHKKDVHKYNPKTDKVPQSSRSGKLSAYEQFLIPPKAHKASSSRESSSDAPQIPSHNPETQMLSFPIPPSVSAATYPPSTWTTKRRTTSYLTHSPVATATSRSKRSSMLGRSPPLSSPFLMPMRGSARRDATLLRTHTGTQANGGFSNCRRAHTLDIVGEA
ncbi:hypothetical protein C8Q80DRAFT_370974 [Daedaleopsis nitida]|nr:hypothetical protein C8Q80DRAFT_370974 [Daedaleopsis nitida]